MVHAVVTAIDDMVKWVRNFETAEVGGAGVIRQMQEDKIEIKEWDRLVGYGYGLMHFDYHGHRGLFHSGQWVGYRAGILYVPDERFAVIALGNAGPSVNLREWDILDLYLGNQLPVPELEESPDSDTTVPVDSVTLDQYVGAYNLGPGEIVTVTHDTSGLLAGFASDPGPHPLTAVSNTEFQFRADGDTMRFESGNAGPASGLYWHGDFAPRVEPFNPTAEELQEFAGTFYSEEIEATMRFLVRDDQLVARHIRWGEDVPFTPTIQDEFRGRSQITQARFVRDADNRITEVVLSGRRAHNLRFFKLEGLLGSGPLPR